MAWPIHLLVMFCFVCCSSQKCFPIIFSGLDFEELCSLVVGNQVACASRLGLLGFANDGFANIAEIIGGT